MKTKGTVTGIVSNLVTVQVDGPVAENEICYIDLQGVKMMAEVIKVNGNTASVQVKRQAVLPLLHILHFHRQVVSCR